MTGNCDNNVENGCSNTGNNKTLEITDDAMVCRIHWWSTGKISRGFILEYKNYNHRRFEGNRRIQV